MSIFNKQNRTYHAQAILLCFGTGYILYSNNNILLLQFHQQLEQFADQNKTWTASTNTEALFVASALGDALGRITEFDTTDEELKKRYPTCYDVSIAKSIETQKTTTLMYTDDTVLSLSVANAIAETIKTKNWTDEQLLSKIAKNIIHDVDPSSDPLYGKRAHGVTAPLAVQKLKNVNQETPGWWKEGAYAPGLGSGSVMRVAPIVFAAPHNLERVQKLAADQSLITHGHPAALAACSAFATGIFYALQKATPEAIAEAMITAAEKFDDQIRKVNTNIPKEPFEEWDEKEKEEDFHIRFRTALIADQLTTADMLRYVFSLWEKRSHAKLANPDIVLGHAETEQKLSQLWKNAGQSSGRSQTGGLLAWNGDEAAAAALYIFLRNSATGDTWKALQEAVCTVGDSDTIATLVGALMGARYGFTLTGKNARLISQLENFEKLKKVAAQLAP